MPIRRLAGLLGLASAGWLFWEGLRTVLIYTSRGGTVSDALLNPPTSALRLLAAALMIIGALAAALSLRGGALIFFLGTVVFAILTAGMAVMGADSSLWSDEAVITAFAMILSAIFAFTHRR